MDQHITIIDQTDPGESMPLYDGPASEAADHLEPGTYTTSKGDKFTIGREYRTSDGVPIVDGLRVLDYDYEIGTVDFAATGWGPLTRIGGEHFDGWFEVRRDKDGRTKSFNGERLTTRHPRTGKRIV